MSQMTTATKLAEFSEEYFKCLFTFRPDKARALGLYEYDGYVPDYTKAGIERRIAELKQQEQSLTTISSEQTEQLKNQDLFDYELFQVNIKNELFMLCDRRMQNTLPLAYLDAIDVSNYIKRNYAPVEERIKGLTTQLAQTGVVLQAAKENLNEPIATPILEIAQTMSKGTTDYLNGDVSAVVAKLNDKDLITRFNTAKEKANEALEDFYQFLEQKKNEGEEVPFAIGPANFQKMLAVGEMVDLPLSEVLAAGERNLRENKERLIALAKQLDPEKSIIQQMKELGSQHPTAETLLEETRNMLEDLRQYLIDHKIVTVPSEVRCKVEETPSFMRWAFAFCSPPGSFDTKSTDAYYFVTLPERDWSAEKQEEWLTKFDYHTLKDVSVHEAYPGHYLQFLHMANAPSKATKTFDCYSYIEGWAHYVEQMMIEEGLDKDNPKLEMAMLAEALVRNVRYVVSIKMHTQGMTISEAIEAFKTDAFMETATAAAEAVRGSFDPGFLNYTLGKLMLLKLREDYKREQGAAFNLQEFHDKVLAYGAPPVPLLRKVLLKENNGTIL